MVVVMMVISLQIRSGFCGFGYMYQSSPCKVHSKNQPKKRKQTFIKEHKPIKIRDANQVENERNNYHSLT